MATLADYYRLLEEHIEFYAKLAQFEQNKLDVVVAHDVLQLDQLVKEEQVYVLQAKGLEQRRMAMQEKIGLGQLTFEQVIEQLDDAVEKQRFRQAKEQLSSQIKIVQHTNESCRQIVQGHLEQVEKQLETAQQGRAKATNGVLNRSC